MEKKVRKEDKIRLAKVKGEKHVNHRGAVVEKLKPGLTCKCSKKCLEQLSTDIKKSIFDQFYSMADKNEQDSHLSGLIRMNHITRRRRGIRKRKTKHDMIPFYLSQFNNIIILGDINVNMLLPHNAVVPFFNNYGFTQLVSFPTRITDLTSSLLDPIFVNQPLLIKSCYTLDSTGVSDHKIVAFDYEVPASTR
nr:unnamed protein product [Callosobruchus analis]